MENIEVKIVAVGEIIEMCKQCLEEGYKDDDSEFIYIQIERLFYRLQDKLGWPTKEEINQKLAKLKEVYSNTHEGLKRANNYLEDIRQEWTKRISSNNI